MLENYYSVLYSNRSMLFSNLSEFFTQLFYWSFFTLPFFGENIQKQRFRNDFFHLLDLLKVFLVNFISVFFFWWFCLLNSLKINRGSTLHRYNLVVIVSSAISRSRSYVCYFFIILNDFFSFFIMKSFLILNWHFDVFKLCFKSTKISDHRVFPKSSILWAYRSWNLRFQLITWHKLSGHIFKLWF